MYDNMGGLGERVTCFGFLLCLLTSFLCSRTARTGGPILTISTPYYVVPRKQVLFGGRNETSANLGVKYPKTPFWERK